MCGVILASMLLPNVQPLSLFFVRGTEKDDKLCQVFHKAQRKKYCADHGGDATDVYKKNFAQEQESCLHGKPNLKCVEFP